MEDRMSDTDIQDKALGGVGLGLAGYGNQQSSQFAKQSAPVSLLQELRNRLHKTSMLIDANLSEHARLSKQRDELNTAITALEMESELESEAAAPSLRVIMPEGEDWVAVEPGGLIPAGCGHREYFYEDGTHYCGLHPPIIHEHGLIIAYRDLPSQSGNAEQSP